jgi:GntR family transcriptional regulator
MVETAPDFRPLYAQVKELLIRRLVEGRWRPGDALPAEPSLAAELGVSQGTVRKALDEMAAANLLERRQGKGTFVARHSRQRSLFHFFHIVGEDGRKELPSSRILQMRSRAATREERRRLDLAPKARVHAMLRLRTIGGAPVLLERLALPETMFPGLALPVGEELPDELYEIYQQRFGVSIVRAAERLRAVAAGPEEVRHLQLAAGAPLLEIDRVALALDGIAAEWRVSRCSTTQHHYFAEIE